MGLAACAWKGIATGISVVGIPKTFLKGHVISTVDGEQKM